MPAMEIFYHQMCKIDKIEVRKMLIKTYKETRSIRKVAKCPAPLV